MLLPSSNFELAYKHIKLHAINNRSKVLVCVAGDCDAISACHIFTVSGAAPSSAGFMSQLPHFPVCQTWC